MDSKSHIAILRLTFLSIFLTMVPALANAQKDFKYIFKIPSDQHLLSKYDEANQHNAYIASITTTSTEQEIRSDAVSRCPQVSNLIFKISDRIIERNNLRVLLGPYSSSFKIDINCLALRRNSMGPGGNAFGVKIPAFLTETSESEDEIAFIIAHEMSHIILQHYQVAPEARKVPVTSEIWANQLGEGSQSEKEADGLATILVANSGYDPRASKEALCNTIRFYDNILSYIPCTVIGLVTNSSHGSNRERYSRIRQILEEIGYSKSPNRIRSIEMLAARKEVVTLKKQFLVDK